MGDDEIIRVLSVDDHEILRGGIRYLLLAVDNVELVGEASSGAEALQLCEKLHPHVVLMDMRMPGMDGVEATLQIRERHPEIQVLVLSSFEEDEIIQRAMQAGAIGYLQKGISVDELAAAIRSAHAGKPTLSPEAFAVLVKGSAPQPQKPSFDLSEREQEVLKMLVQGLSNNKIAKCLVITEATVKFHISNIFKKFNASNRTEAAAIAVQQGLVRE